MTNSTNEPPLPSVNADHSSNAVGSISVGGDISGNITIGNTTGYTAEQVSVLIAQIQSTFQPKPFDGRCPYKGLDVFEEEDAELFFGREKLVDDLVSRVKDSRTIFVTGPSGSGKSSLVRAGLIHALKQGAIKGSDRWLYATMKPGRDPIESLASAFSRLKSPELGNYFRQHVDQLKVLHECAESALTDNKNQRLVLFIDQFEEVFTQINNEEERVAFLNLLTHAATIENGRVIILFSMRSDFVSNCATYPQLNELLSKQFRQIGAMQPEELVSAIAQPALRVRLRIDPDLIAQIINEMKGEPGALPLMQFALKDLFDSQQDKNGVIALILNDYLQRGGIHKALEHHADDAFSKLSNHEQELARSIFSGLIEIGRGTQDTKRTAIFDELVPANTKAEDVEAIVQKLADARLVTTDEQAGRDTVTISHEKLIDAWPWLHRLVNENRDVIALQNQITADAKEWVEHKKDTSYLYSGGRLANVREQVKKQKLILGNLAQEFVQTAKARQRRLQTILISAVLLVVIASIIASVVFQNQAQKYAEAANFANTQQAAAQTNAEEAQKQTRIAQAGELAAQSAATRNENFSLSLLLGIESFKKADTTQSQSILLQNTQTNIQLVSYFYRHSSTVNSLALNQDNSILASGGCTKYNDIYKNCERGEVILWNLESKAPIRSLSTALDGDVTSLAFSPRDTLLASGSCKKAGTQSSACKDGQIILWSQHNFEIKKEIILPDSGLVKQIRFSSSGKYLMSVSEDDIIRVWNVETDTEISSIKPGMYIESALFSLDEKSVIIATVDNIRMYEITTDKAGEVIYSNPNDYRLNTVTFSEDGSMAAIAYSPFNGVNSIGWVYFWDLNKKNRLAQR
ncbi:MAG: AAA family ATPase [Anaerolineales bacterium]|nr:AAA family ATPase [Anaerolineales bacterium]